MKLDVEVGESIYTATIPSQVNRSLVRYRIRSIDREGVSVRVPYPDDPSLNFALFCIQWRS